jgi:regulator of RNase E activity RraB
MAEEWDFYICQMDSKPASIYLNLKAASDTAIADNPYSAYVRVYMRNPREDGLSSNEEFDQLVAIEDAVIDGLAAAKLATFVGRITSDGCRDLYFYAPTEKGIEPAVHGLMAAFSDYEYETGGRPEPDWETYLNFLYPTAEDYQRIQNRRVCSALEKAGDAFTVERPIEHWVYFPAEDAQQRFVKEALELGYQLDDAFGPTADDARYGVRVSCNAIPSFAEIDGLTVPLFRLAQEYGGDYDGWETQVVKVDE